MEKDAYDIAKNILSLWESNVNKYSGMIDKQQLAMPLVVKKKSGEITTITSVEYQPNIGIILSLKD